GFKVIREYTDSAMTGTNDNRPAFQQMIRDSASHRFRAVIVWKLDRFARNRKVASDYKAELKVNGVNLYYAMETVPEGSSGIIFDGLLESMAEYYSANLSENIRRGQYDSAIEHKTLGARVLGLRKSANDTFEIDPETAPIVKRIFTEYASGKPYADIIADLNSDGLKTVKGTPFRNNSLRSILRNEKYVGTYKFKDLVNDENVIPAIIDRELFDTVQGMLEGGVHRAKLAEDKEGDCSPYLLVSKLFCGHCGEPMTGESGKSKTGRVYRYYSCNGTKSRSRNGCKKKRVPKELIEREVIRIINNEILTDEFIESMIDVYMEDQEKNEHAEAVKMYEAKLKETKRKIENIMRAIEDGIYTPTTKERLLELEATRDGLLEAIENEKIIRPKVSRETLREFFRMLKAGNRADSETQSFLISQFVKRIYLFDDDGNKKNQKIMIELNVNDKNGEPVSFEIVRSVCGQLHSKIKGIDDSFFCSSISSNHARMARAVNRWMPILLHTGILISDQSD
ncbi:MAG: recombinase family protein, partial [Solobacterium sp.]|nr:recombinase family protein [Solobacterium sp.]